MKTALSLFVALSALASIASAEEAQNAIDKYNRVETVPAQPRPLTDPKTGQKPVYTIGTSEHYLPDPDKARLDAVSPESREHLETLIKDLKKR